MGVGLGELIATISGLFSQLGNITGGPCGGFDWKYTVKGWVAWGFVWKNIQKTYQGVVPFPNCPGGSRCCVILDQQIWVNGTIKGTINNVRIMGWLSRPNIRFNLALSVNEHLVFGVCIINGCPCPPKVMTNITINVGTIDIGTKEYPDPPFPALRRPPK